MEDNNNIKSKTLKGLFWTFAEQFGGRLVGFVVQILLARLMMPEDYGVIGIVLVFINVCNVFVESGFGKALVQKKDADDLDFSSVFYINLAVVTLLYVLLYIAAPYIAAFYELEIVCPVLRVLGLRLFIAAFQAVQRAKNTKEMQFKRYFASTVGGTLVSGIVGIVFAYFGFGVWALAAQNLTNIFINTLVLFFTVRWRPKLMFSFSRAKRLFSYGWKVLANSLLETLYDDFRNLYIGKLYNADALAYYTRGRQYPQLVVDNVNSSISSVLFPALASKQDDRSEVVGITRRAMKTSAYVLTPMLLGLAAVAEPLVLWTLTEKWLPCVPYLQILCINYALAPLQTANTQTLYAIGRTDLVLKLSFVKKVIGLTMVIVFARISVMAMAWAGVGTAFINLLINAYPNKKLLGYGFWEQMKDVVPCWLISVAMMLIVMSVSLLNLSTIPELVVMILVGVAAYVVLSLVFRVESFTYILNNIKPLLAKLKKK